MDKVRLRSLIKSQPHTTAQFEPLHRLHALSVVHGLMLFFLVNAFSAAANTNANPEPNSNRNPKVLQS